MGLVTISSDMGATAERLRPVVRRAVDGATLAEMTAGCLLLDVLEEGRPVGALALDFVGDACTVTAAARQGVTPPDEWPQVEAIARQWGAKRIRMLTRRPALVRRMIEREGFACAVLEKEI